MVGLPTWGFFPPTFYDFAFNYYGFVDILTFLVIIVIAYKNDAFKKLFNIFRLKIYYLFCFLLLVEIFLLLWHIIYIFR